MEQEKELNAKSSLIRAYQDVFTTVKGKRILQDLMKNHFMLDSTFDPDSPNVTSFREGERNVVIRILSMLNINPNLLLTEIKNISEESNSEDI